MDITIISTADWKAAAWTNKQHVASTLVKLGHSVLYIEGIGIRTPTFAAQDTRRIFRRIRRLFTPLTRVEPGVHVLSLPFLPWHKSRLAGFINRMVISQGIRLAERLLRFRDTVLWTYHPLTTKWLRPERYRKSLYHCVDEIGAQPGMALELIQNAEHDLAGRVDYLCTTAPSLADKLRGVAKTVEFMPNVADFDHFNSALKENAVVARDLKEIPEPRCGFIGAISGYKVDLNLVIKTAELKPDWSFVMIGEVGLGQTGFTVEALPSNVYLLGPRPYAELPSYCKGFTVGLLPYHINDYTKGVFPMKLFEYMAAGLPVISTRLPALVSYDSYVLWADDPIQLSARLDAVAAGECPSMEARLELAKSNTYVTRTLKMLGRLIMDVRTVPVK